MHIYVYVCLCVCVFIYAYVYVYLYMHMCTIYAHAYVYSYVCAADSLCRVVETKQHCEATPVMCYVPSVVSDSATPWTVARQAPLSVRFSRQEHWSGLSFPSPGDLPDPGIEPVSH